MNWKGIEIKSVEEISQALSELKNETEGKEFMTMARAIGPNADSVIGFLLGYFADERSKELAGWLGIEYPAVSVGVAQ